MPVRPRDFGEGQADAGGLGLHDVSSAVDIDHGLTGFRVRGETKLTGGVDRAQRAVQRFPTQTRLRGEAIGGERLIEDGPGDLMV